MNTFQRDWQLGNKQGELYFFVFDEAIILWNMNELISIVLNCGWKCLKGNEIRYVSFFVVCDEQ